ncbi:MAG TPA: hypothetical protein VF582_02925 [Allosphingosinicella sp.]|jgi:hypothetical protein
MPIEPFGETVLVCYRSGLPMETVRAFFRRSLLLITAAASLLPDLGVAGGGETSPAPVPQHGLQIQLRTSAYEVRLDPAQTTRPTMVASAVLANRSRRSTVGFIFPSQYAAEQVFRFRLFNSAGEQLWASDQHVRVIPGETPRDLLPGNIWRATSEIPLAVEGELLPAGTYTIEALIDAQPQLLATTVFRVVRGPKPPPTKALVYSVEEVRYQMIPTFAPPAEVRVEARGTVTSGGWSAPELRLRTDGEAGYLEFDFVAVPPPPGAVVITALQPVTAVAQVPVPANFRGVRVHAQTNTVTTVNR